MFKKKVLYPYVDSVKSYFVGNVDIITIRNLQ